VFLIVHKFDTIDQVSNLVISLQANTNSAVL